MEITKLIEHPELMNKETLFTLRKAVALHPYFQTARLLMLQNLYLLHDSSFYDELRRAAIYLTDRKVLFNLIEVAHYQVKSVSKERGKPSKTDSQEDRTISLIDNFLDTVPEKDEDQRKKKRKPTAADATVDYVAYLMETREESENEGAEDAPLLKGQELIDDFLEKSDEGKIKLHDEQKYKPEGQESGDEGENEEGIFTETLAKIYIRQGRYSKALEIINKLNLNYPKKNGYFADQIRFLEKLILNDKNKKN